MIKLIKKEDLNVSVVIPFYNRSEFLLRLLNSIKAQTLPVSKIYIIDNGSTPREALNTWNIIRSHSLKNKCTFVSTLQIGNANYARNLGYELAETEYVAFLDSDDWWDPNHLQDSIDILKSSDAAGVYSGCFVHTSDNVIKIKSEDVNNVGNPFDFLLTGIGFKAVTPSFVINKQVLGNSLLWDTKLKRHQDYDYFANIFYNSSGWCFSPKLNTNVDRLSDGTSTKKVDFNSMILFFQKWENYIPYNIKKEYLYNTLCYAYKASAPEDVIAFYREKIEDNNYFDDFTYKLICKKPLILTYNRLSKVLDVLHLKSYIRKFI